jgi:D-alanyl-D-alanine carboxypeptidase/D-alanyl-D-alanine-endopeptidase (penicillin-binding protein 4)
MVETMLTESDNDMSEILSHLAGAELTGAGSFASSAAATLATLQSMGVPVSGVEFVDGSGLSYEDAASPLTLASAIAASSGATAPSWTWPVVLGLPVAGLTGTLADRFTGSDTRAAAGFVRAKTGTLIGVSTLAGTVVDADGRLLAFAFMSNETTDIDSSRAALDRAAAALAACGCRA